MFSSSSQCEAFNTPFDLPQTHMPSPAGKDHQDRHIKMSDGMWSISSTIKKITTLMNINPGKVATTPISNCYPRRTHRTSAPQSSSSKTSPQMARPFRTVYSCTRKNGTRYLLQNNRNRSQPPSPSSTLQAQNTTSGYSPST